MKVKIISQDEREIKLLLSETTVSNVNSIRRAIITDVPKMAISIVRFEMGVKEPNIKALVQSALNDPSCGGNPIKLTKENMTRLFESCL